MNGIHKSTPPRKRCRAYRRAGFLTALVVTVSSSLACDSDAVGNGRTLFMMSIEEVSGNNQVVPAGGVESEPLVVRVVDQNGTPHRGFIIDWTIREGDGSVSNSSVASDSDGRVEVKYRSGDSEGEAVVEATLSPASSGNVASRPVTPAVFHLTVTAAD